MTEIPLDIEVAELDSDQLIRVIEAILLVADEPIVPIELAATLSVAPIAVERSLEALAGGYKAREAGIELRQVAGGWRLYTADDLGNWVERYVRDGQVSRLTQAALETLAVIAYRQPISRARVSAIRGVNVDSVVKTLEARGLVEVDHADASTGALLFRTTTLFLDKLGLANIDDLPQIADFLPDIETISSLEF